MHILRAILYCSFQVVMIDRERLISKKQNNKAIAEGAMLSKEAMLLRDIFKFTSPSLDEFRSFGLDQQGLPRGITTQICLFGTAMFSTNFLYRACQTYNTIFKYNGKSISFWTLRCCTGLMLFQFPFKISQGSSSALSVLLFVLG